MDLAIPSIFVLFVLFLVLASAAADTTIGNQWLLRRGLTSSSTKELVGEGNDDNKNIQDESSIPQAGIKIWDRNDRDSVPATAFVNPPSNDACFNAVVLQPGDEITGTTVSATLDVVNTCGSMVTAPGVWYKVTGKGTSFLAGTCSSESLSTSFDTKISVYEGSCVNLVCVAGVDDSCGLWSEVLWEAEELKDYYILVHGFTSSVGEFILDIVEVIQPTNDFCDGATSLEPEDSVSGSTILATVDPVNLNGTGLCTNAITAPGVWFSILGTGNALTVSTCQLQDFDTKLSVFTGTCGSLDCVAENDDSCDLGSVITWVSQLDVHYYVLLHGFFDSKGSYTVDVREQKAGFNDLCADAIHLQPGASIVNSTVLATFDNVGTCDTENTSPGVWYSVFGTGNQLRASTCNHADFDTKISVFEGTCDTLVCISGNDDACIFRSEVDWKTTEDQKYYILVHGFASETGEFNLELIDLSQSDNDACRARDVDIGESLLDNTALADVPIDLDECGTTITSPGKWYRMSDAGSRTRVLRASTCSSLTNFDTKLSVFSGSCTNLTCVDGNDNSETCGFQSEVEWTTEQGRENFILVHGFGDSTGDFELTIADTDVPIGDASGVVNDFCRGALLLQPGGTIDWTTIGATFENVFDDDSGNCGSAGDAAPGVWFQLKGTGSRLKARTCRSTSTYDTQLAVFTGSCEGLVCVGGNDDSCSLLSEVEWVSQSNQDYFILVHGYGGETGNFTLDVQIGAGIVPLPNDDCRSATKLVPGGNSSGSTSEATFDHDAVFCGIDNTAPGVWYSVLGAGNVFIASTCSSSTLFDTRLTVFTGNCETLECVAGNDDATCGLLQSEVTWQSMKNVEYYLLVHGFGTARGNFTIQIEEIEQLLNDNCENALPLQITTNQTLATNGSTLLATLDDDVVLPECVMPGFTTSPGVWYFVNSTEAPTLEASTCAFADFDTKITVFSGTCGALVCVDGNDDWCGVQSKIRWDTTRNEGYYIFVHGFGTETGDFTLDIVEIFPIDLNNDDCDRAFAISIGDTIAGSTSDASFDDVDSCVTEITAPGIWFAVVGTGGPLTVSTCSSSSYDTRITVFDGSCTSLSCIGENDDSCGLQSSVTWNSLSNVKNFVLVHGFSTITGDFILDVAEGRAITVPPTSSVGNDFCTGAESLVTGQSSTGSTSEATFDNVGFCDTSNTAAGVWFSIIGTGNEVTASTCNSATSFDTKLTVFMGTCGSLDCVGGNDDWCGLQSQLTWDTVRDVQYYVLVHGFAGATGDFTIDIEGVVDTFVPTGSPLVENDNCINAIELEVGRTSAGSTSLATVDNVGVCSVSTTAPGVWYFVIGTALPLTVSTCSFATFDTKLSVFSGSCESLSCVNGNDDACDLQSTVTWDSTQDEEYYILVHGWESETGSFEVTVEESESATTTSPSGTAEIIPGNSIPITLLPTPLSTPLPTVEVATPLPTPSLPTFLPTPSPSTSPVPIDEEGETLLVFQTVMIVIDVMISMGRSIGSMLEVIASLAQRAANAFRFMFTN